MLIQVGNRSIELNARKVKALEYEIDDIADWVFNAVNVRCRKAMATVVTKYSDRQANKLTDTEQETIVQTANIVSAKQRTILAQEEQQGGV